MSHVFWSEWRVLRHQPGFWILLGVYVLLLAYGAVQSADRVADRVTQVSAAHQDYDRRWSALRAAAQAPAGVWGDWRLPSLVGGPSGFAVTWMPVDGLAALSPGESTRQPSVRRISIFSSDEEPPLQNPLAPAGGPFDLSFVVIWLLPLTLLAALHGVVSADRQQGTWALLAATTQAPGRVLAARLLWPAAVFGTATIAAGAITILASAPTDDGGLVRFAAWCGLVAGYAGFWTMAAGVVTAQCSTVPLSLGFLGLLWIVVVWVSPGLIDQGVLVGDPPPNNTDAYLAIRETGRDLERKLPRMLEEVYARHPQWRPPPDLVAAASRPVPGGPASRDTRRVYVPALISAEVAAPFADAAIARRDRTEQLVKRLSIVSPALAFQVISDHLAGTSAERFVMFDRHAAEAERAWHAFFASRILQLQEMTRADLDAVSTPPPFATMPSASGLAWPIGGLALWIVLAGGLLVRARRYLRI
jgi:ABC-2 type transport system permease protein